MRTKQLVAGAAIVGGAGLVVVGLGPMVVTADASPPIASNEPDPSGPTLTIEPAPSAPSPDIASDTGIAPSTDTGSSMPADPAAPPSDTQRPADGAPARIQLPVIQMECPMTWATGAAPCGAHARPTGPARLLLGHGTIRSGPTRPTRGSPRPSYRRRACCRHNGMLRLPRRCSTGPDGLPRLRRWLATVGLPVFRQLGPTVRRRMPDAGSYRNCSTTHLGASRLSRVLGRSELVAEPLNEADQPCAM